MIAGLPADIKSAVRLTELAAPGIKGNINIRWSAQPCYSAHVYSRTAVGKGLMMYQWLQSFIHLYLFSEFRDTGQTTELFNFLFFCSHLYFFFSFGHGSPLTKCLAGKSHPLSSSALPPSPPRVSATLTIDICLFGNARWQVDHRLINGHEIEAGVKPGVIAYAFRKVWNAW